MKNPISFEVPKIVFDECFLVSDNNTRLFRKLIKGEDAAFSEVGLETHMKLFNIFNTVNLHEETLNNTKASGLSILRLYAQSNRMSLGELSYLFVADPLIKQIALMHHFY